MVGIVILNYNNWKDTEECVRSILEKELRTDYQIYLVDNASPAQPSEEQKRFLREAGAVQIRSEENRGYSAGNNLGIRRALDDGCSAVLISNQYVR